MNQAIVRHSHVSVVTFLTTPSKETRAALEALGFIYNPVTRQHVRKRDASDIQDEQTIAREIAA